MLVRAPNRSGGGCGTGLGTKNGWLLGLAMSANDRSLSPMGSIKQTMQTGSSRVAVAACKSQLIDLTGAGWGCLKRMEQRGGLARAGAGGQGAWVPGCLGVRVVTVARKLVLVD